MIRGSDGLEYADEAALLLREPIDNFFNERVQSHRKIAERFRLDPNRLIYVNDPPNRDMLLHPALPDLIQGAKVV